MCSQVYLSRAERGSVLKMWTAMWPKGSRVLLGTQRLLSTTPDSRGFRVLGVQQIAVGSSSKEKLSNFWVDALGIQKISTFRSEKENVDEDILQCGEGDRAVEIDIMQPIGMFVLSISMILDALMYPSLHHDRP